MLIHLRGGIRLIGDPLNRGFTLHVVLKLVRDAAD